MLVALNSCKQRVLGWEVTKQDGPFLCPGCNEDVILRKGFSRIHHFAHKRTSQCSYGAGETETHRKTKEGIYRSIDSRKTPAILECPVFNQRPDVFLLVDGQFVAVEVQVSTLSIDEICRRTEGYTKNNISVLWLICEPIPDNGDLFTLKEWQYYLHTMYYGRLYYYFARDYVMPVNFNRTPSGRRANLAPAPLSISDPNSFHAIKRKEFSYTRRGWEFSFPSVKLWTDKTHKWWETYHPQNYPPIFLND